MIYKSMFDVRKVNGRMKPQKCEAIRVVDGENWEDYIWPSKVVSSSEVDSSMSEMLSGITITTNIEGDGNIVLGGNYVMGNLTL